MLAEDVFRSRRILLPDRFDQGTMLSMTLAGNFWRKVQVPDWVPHAMKRLDESCEHAVAARQSDLVMQLKI